MLIWRSPSKHLAAFSCSRRCLLRACLRGWGRRLSALAPRGERPAARARSAVSSRRAAAGHLCAGLPCPDLLQAGFVHPPPGRRAAVYLGRKHGELGGCFCSRRGRGRGGSQARGGGVGAAAHHGSPPGLCSLHSGIINLRVKQLFVCPLSLPWAAFSLLLIHPS